MRSTRAAITGGIVAAALTAAPALAAPANGQIVTLTCTNGATYTVATPFGGNSENARNQFTPGHILGTDQVIVPYSFTFTATDTSTGATQSQSFSKPATLPAGTVDCTFDAGSDGSLVFTGEVVGVIR